MSLRFEAEVKDPTPRSRKFTMTLDVHPDDLAALSNPQTHRRVLRDLTAKCVEKMIAAEPWVCSGSRSCGRAATKMLNSPSFWPAKDGQLPVIRDMCPIMLCDDPKCKEMAKDLAQSAFSAMGMAPTPAATTDPVPPLTAQCSKCGRVSVELLRCARCGKAWYCNRDCQKGHWKEHKINCKNGEDTGA
eukprot:scaffold67421_cov33-Tisochrysis_lutea.AAC.3